MQLVSFYNDPKIKEKYLKRVKAHYKADEIVRGVYWKNGKGCAVGCTIESSTTPHKTMEKELGIPEWLAMLEDKIFEGLPNGEAKEFPVRFLEAIKPGADLSKVEYKFKLWLLIDKHNGVIQYANEETKKIIRQIAKLQKEASEGRMPSEEKWSAARSAVWSAESAESAAWSAESAARSAAWSAAWSAAESAARSAESAAESAARSAESAARSAESAARSAESAARSAAWSAVYKNMADKLISLLKEVE